MSINEETKTNIENILKSSIRKKFENYQPEPASMPFHTRLLGKDRLALYSFIHSLSTNFGTSIFEPVALELARSNFVSANTHVKTGSEISDVAQARIQEIMNNLITASTSPNKIDEISRIREVCLSGTMKKVKPTVVDVIVVNSHNEIYMFDIKTAKPNVGGFKEFKRTLLEWVAVYLARYPNAQINTLIAIPYNPYEPQPYSRWTMRGMLDLDHELMVSDEFWDFLGGEGAYQDLLDCFERVGVELRDEIDNYFDRFREIS